MLQTEYASWTMVKQMHKDHVSAAASLDILLMIAGARKWTAIIAGGKAMQHGHVCTVVYGDDQVTVRISKVDDSSDGFWVRCKLEGNSVKMQRDTRSRASLVSCDVHKKFLMHLPLRPSDTVFKGYTGQRVPMRGMTEVFNAMTKLLSCLYVTHNNFPAIMGHEWLKKIRLHWQEVRKLSHGSTQLQVILGKHKKFFFNEEMGSMKKLL